jgi:hypothetical protein
VFINFARLQTDILDDEDLAELAIISSGARRTNGKYTLFVIITRTH